MSADVEAMRASALKGQIETCERRIPQLQQQLEQWQAYRLRLITRQQTFKESARKSAAEATTQL